MAGKDALFKSLLSCHVCKDTFKDPVTLSCNHNFCSSCLQNFWEKAGNRNCPICERKSSKDSLGVNYTLKELADSLAGRKKTGSSETEKGEKEVVCSEHQEGDLKYQLESELKSLQEKRKKYEEVEKTYKEMIQHSKNQLESTEKQIRVEFDELRQFLREEEESRLAALRKEEEQKRMTISGEMKRIQDQISSLSDSISAIEEDLQKHNVSFLSSYKPTQTRARAQCSLSDPQLVSGALIDVAKHLGNLSFRVCEKMKEKVQFSPVILDPNTANPWIYLSGDLTSVRRGNQQLPDNPERSMNYATVLGSEGFSSGKHSWEVEVGDYPSWYVGLAKESADRKGRCPASPGHGIWCLEYRRGNYTDGLGRIATEKKNLQRIRVKLDYKKGKVSFYDPEDTAHIYTYRDTFTEKLFPYFSIGEAVDAKTTDIKICQSEISL